MNRSLLLLLRLHARAVVRRALRGMRTPKGATFAAIGIAVFLLWLVPVMITSTQVRKSDPQTVRAVAPIVLLMLCGLTLVGGSGDRAISFTPGEVNFLFPGPFTRRELLFYKLARTAGGVLLSAGILSVVLLQHAPSWRAAITGAVLAMAFVQLLSLVVILTAQSAGARAYTAARRLLLGALVAAAAVALVPAVRKLTDAGAAEAAATLGRSRAARVVLAPFTPFARAFTATDLSELLTWGGVAAGINLVLLAVVVRLDADYREAALAASQRSYERLQRLRRGQLIPQAGGADGARSSRGLAARWRRVRVPVFPWLGGAGPTAWRQATAALRTSRYTLLVLLVFSVAVTPMFFAGRRSYVPALFAAGWLTMFLTMMVKFDFRAELDQMAWLKALPLRPAATAAGQLATPVLVLTLAQALLVGTAAVLAPPGQRAILLGGLPFLVPFNLVVIAVENLLFLLFPSRTAGAAPGDVGAMGRQIVFFLLKLLVIAAACGVAGALAAVVIALSGSVVAGAIAGFIALSVVAASLVPCVGWAYSRFDPSTDTPA